MPCISPLTQRHAQAACTLCGAAIPANKMTEAKARTAPPWVTCCRFPQHDPGHSQAARSAGVGGCLLDREAELYRECAVFGADCLTVCPVSDCDKWEPCNVRPAGKAHLKR